MTQQTHTPTATLTHVDSNGEISMVDVSTKAITQRTATATGKVIFPPEIYQAIKQADGMTKKGSITQTAHIAGIMGAKRTSDLIPLCHQLPLDGVKLSFDYDDKKHAIIATATAKVTHKTGVEMEALTAVSVACLTIYDMTKAMSHDIIIGDICLLNKTGGKSDYVK
ncbi:cyclic pyranopterin monophosphate synthase MoaC [Moraxella sp. ZJ142]|uniref:cyclic pyranopterin monophosphate synthase MoaC n=1 Tax=Moraxella marmotae TaxID=3344520 RepID=UPI0035D47E6C